MPLCSAVVLATVVCSYGARCVGDSWNMNGEQDQLQIEDRSRI